MSATFALLLTVTVVATVVGCTAALITVLIHGRNRLDERLLWVGGTIAEALHVQSIDLLNGGEEHDDHLAQVSTQLREFIEREARHRAADGVGGPPWEWRGAVQVDPDETVAFRLDTKPEGDGQ